MDDNVIYAELTGFLARGNEAPPPRLPDNCPVCRSAATFLVISGENATCAIYGCGGSYTPKPQIQNHTRVWWGSCGKREDNAIVALAAYWIKGLVSDSHETACRILDKLTVESEREVDTIALHILDAWNPEP